MQFHKINKTTLSGPTKIYVNNITGDDSNTGLSLDYPVKTVEKAVSLSEPNGLIVVSAGTYIFTKPWDACFGDKGLKIIGDFCKTIFDIHYTDATNINFEFYNITFIRTNNVGEGIVLFYSYRYYTKFHFYNCLFKQSNYTENQFFYLNNTGNPNRMDTVLFQNCTFYGNNANISSIGYPKVVNCAIEKTNSYNNQYFITSLEGCILDENGYITNKEFKNIGTGTNPDKSPANIGIYGGEFAIAKKSDWFGSGWNLGILTVQDSKDMFSIDEYSILKSTDKLETLVSSDIVTHTDKKNIKLKKVENTVNNFENTLVLNNNVVDISL